MSLPFVQLRREAVSLFAARRQIFNHEVPLTATVRPATIIGITTVIIVAAVYGPKTFSWPLLATCAALYCLFFGLGFSVGFHRGLIHRTYRTSQFVEGMLALLGTLAGCQGPLTSFRSHSIRSFYQNRSDPPPPFDYRQGFARSAWYFLFVLSEPEGSALMRVPTEIADSRWMCFLDKHAPALQLVVFALLYAAGGWPLLVWGGFVRLASVFVLYTLLDYFGHHSGHVRYSNEDASTPGYNSAVLGIIMLGEGWHNNHHAVPRSARFGHAWWELDLSFLAIRMMEMLGLVSDLIVRTSIDMQAKTITHAGSPGTI
jgi:fatty-acid desaturase